VNKPDIVLARQHVKHFIWKHGWDLRPVTPLNGIDVLLWRLLPELGVNCVIDVGAHTGEYGMLLRALGYHGRIASFEPTSAALTSLRQRTAQDSDWDAYPIALGSSTGSADLHVANASNFSSFHTSSGLGRSLFGPEFGIPTVEHVQIRRLDEMFAELVQGIDDPRVYLKLDTQGWDLEAFSGAAGCLDRIVAAQSEMSIRPIYDGMPNQCEALAAFQAAGYDVVGMYPLPPSPDGLLTEFDCVMIRRPAGTSLDLNGAMDGMAPRFKR
jgi:FkbM family methyltransferase